MPLSWIDIIMPLVVVRCALTGRESGLIAESFKLVGILFATFISLHYYPSLGDALHKNLMLDVSIKSVYSFSLLAIGVHFLFSIIREGWSSILDIDIPSFINKWAGLIFSVIRAYLVCGLILLGLSMVQDKNIQTRVKYSLSTLIFKDASTGIYSGFYSGLIKKFFPSEPINEEVFKLNQGEVK